MCQVNGRWSFSATWGSETPEPIHLTSGLCDYFHSPTPHATYGGCRKRGWSGVGIWVKLYPCVFFIFTGRTAANRQPAGIKFTRRPKIRLFVPQGRFVAPIQVKLGTTDGHLGPLGSATFHLNHHREWECGPKNIKNFHFLERSRPVGAKPLTDFEIFRGFIRLTMLH